MSFQKIVCIGALTFLLSFLVQAAANERGIDVEFYDDLERSGNLFWIDVNGQSFVEIAIATGQNERALRLLDAGSLDHLDPRYPLTSVFLSAVDNADARIIEKVLYIAKESGRLDQLPLNEALQLAVISNVTENVELLVRHGASYNELSKRAPDLLVGIIQLNQVDMAINLIEGGFPVQLINENGRTPLMVAVIESNNELVELLIKKGADIHMKDVHQVTALGFALASANAGDKRAFEAIDILVRNGASPCDRNLVIPVDAKDDTATKSLEDFYRDATNAEFQRKQRAYGCDLGVH